MKLNTYKLKLILNDKGLRQYQLADRMGVTKAAVSWMIKNPDSISLKRISQIANILEIDPKQLIGY